MVYTREQRKVYQAEYRRKRRDEAVEYLGGTCVVCGTTDRLEINHIDPREKAFNPSRFWGKLADYWTEIDKCNLLCKDHHVEETRRQYREGLL
jgi:hypothetical protein